MVGHLAVLTGTEEGEITAFKMSCMVLDNETSNNDDHRPGLEAVHLFFGATKALYFPLIPQRKERTPIMIEVLFLPTVESGELESYLRSGLEK